MDNYSIQITGYLLTQSWQIAVFVVVVAAVVLALRNRSAHVRYLLWLIVLAKCLVPPLLTIPLPVLPEQRAVIVVPPTELIAVEPTRTSVVETPVLPGPVNVKHTPKFTIRQWLALGWIVGASVFVLVAVVKALRTEFWLRRERKLLPAGLQSEIEELFSGLGVRISPTLWLVEGIGQPFVWGLLRGSIYLPGNFTKVDVAEHRRGILGHELSHILRFDAAVNLLQIVAQGVFWFHPLVWWANKRIRAEREKCCDEMVIARWGAQARDYSKAIVNILITEHESTRPVPSLAIAGPVKNIEERINTMLRPGKKFYKHPSPAVLLCVVLVALLAVPTAFVLTASGGTQPTTKSLNEGAADSEKPEQPLYAARTFNSKLAFEVWVRETRESGDRQIGQTPSATSLEIPACRIWWVKLSTPLKDSSLLAQEMSRYEVPGLQLPIATDSDLKHLGGLTELRYLDLTRTRITDAGVAYLGGLTGLEQLRLDVTPITDASLEHLKGLTRLQRLDLSGTKITDSGLEHLKGLTELRYLSLIHDRIADAGLAHLKGLSELRGLDLARTPITDVGLAHLKNLTRLQWMTLYQTKITDAGLKYLEGMKELEGLELHATAITDAGLEHLKGLTRLEELSLDDTRITDAGLTYLKGLTGLHDLWLSAPEITDAGLADLECLAELQSLSLSSERITDAGLEHLKSLAKLQGLWLSAPRVTDAGLARLAAKTGAQWRYLGLSNAQITNAGLEHLKGMNGLESLHLNGTQISDAGLEHLKGLTGLQRLNLSNTGVTDAGLEHLKDLTGLRNLNLSGNQVTDAGVQRLQQSLPNLTITRGQAQSTAQSTDKPAQSISGAAADSEKSEQPRYAARTFNSELAFIVFVRTTQSTFAPKPIGQTPSTAPLEIPPCQNWGVQPLAPVTDWDLLIREMSEKKVPGLRLKVATDSDLSHLAGLTGLQYLDLTRTKSLSQ